MVILHFGNGGLSTLKDSRLAHLFDYGQYGVHVFFVISGFIIPYALYRSGYRLNDYFRHVGRRFVRIDPPAYISVIFIAALYYGAVLILGRPISGMEWPGTGTGAVLANLTYTVDYFDTSWYNGVFWTLAIEFQFYLVVGLLLPLLVNGNTFTSSITIIGLLLLFYIPFNSFFRYGSFFVMGIIAFMQKERLLANAPAFGLMLLSCIACLLQRGPVETAFAFFTVTCIIFFSFSTKITDHLGKISFSLYLTHLFAGWTAEIFVKKIFFVPGSETAKYVMLVVYITWSVVFATFFYRFVELPFIRLSKRISWKDREQLSVSGVMEQTHIAGHGEKAGELAPSLIKK